MYNLELSESFFPSQSNVDIWEVSTGCLLRNIASKHASEQALAEIDLNGNIGRRWTYGELLNDSEKLAEGLLNKFHKGEKIVVWAPNCPEWVMLEYACALSGIILVTANPAFQAKELKYVLEQSGAVALFRVKDFRGNPMEQIGEEATKDLRAVREIIELEKIELLFSNRKTKTRLPNILPTDPAQIQYTSGTTGFPKGAVLSHRGLVNNARFYASRCGVQQNSIWINIMPMFHTSGCGMVTLGCLQAGCQMILVGLFDPKIINRLVESEKVSIILGVPTMIISLLDDSDQNSYDLSSLNLVSCGGSMVAPELVRRVKKSFNCKFSTLYGQTEHSPVITQHHLSDSLNDICNTAGQPIPQTDVSIRRIKDNSVAATGEVGEICARGPGNMIGYHANDAATKEAIDEDGWLHTGDLGTMDYRGYVRITGRVKEMIIRGGENHFPAEIENALLEHSSIAEVAVVGIPDKRWGEVIGCFIRAEKNRKLDINDLRRHCRKILSPQKTPVIWCRVNTFPLTGSGKIKKFVLRKDFVSGKYVGES